MPARFTAKIDFKNIPLNFSAPSNIDNQQQDRTGTGRQKRNRTELSRTGRSRTELSTAEVEEGGEKKRVF